LYQQQYFVCVFCFFLPGVGLNVGGTVGCDVGRKVGADVGCGVGTGVGANVGTDVGTGVATGCAVGSTRQPHTFEIESAANCDKKHSPNVNSVFCPCASNDKHCTDERGAGKREKVV
jgi:hypothetical protein